MSRTVIALSLAKAAEYLNSPDPADIDTVVKILNSAAKDIGKVVPEKKADPYAGLPMLQVTMVNGAMQVTLHANPVEPTLVQELEAEGLLLPAEPDLPEFLVPSTNMLVSTHINSDVLDD
jgi:hypothetical protein